MKIFLPLLAGIFLSNPVWSDATLIYELQGPENNKKQVKISISGEGVRINEYKVENSALIFQAGHLFPLYAVNHDEKTYQRLTPEFKAYLRVDKDRKVNKDLFSYPEITLKSAGKQQKVSGIKCRLVHEYIDEKPVIEHCLANSARSGLSERETRSLIRTYAILRKHTDTDWPGAGTTDEVYVSVRSRHLDGDNSMELKSVSYDLIDTSYLRIPREYKLVDIQKND